MMTVTKKEFSTSKIGGLDEFYDSVFSVQSIALKDLQPAKTALVVVDMINGFVKEGELSSTNACSILPDIVTLFCRCKQAKIKTICFADSHTPKSPEFDSYPVHCLAGTAQSQIVDEIAKEGDFTLIKKNSTNGFLEPAFVEWLQKNQDITTFLVVGCCTDICVQQFALTLKCDFNRRNVKSRVIVPISLTSTYDAPGHDSELVDLVSYYNMQVNGIEVTTKLEF